MKTTYYRLLGLAICLGSAAVTLTVFCLAVL